MFVNMFLFDKFIFLTIGIPEIHAVFGGDKIITTKYTHNRTKTIVAPLVNETKMSRS